MLCRTTTIYALLVGALLAGCHDMGDFSAFDATTIARTGSFELEMSPEEALPLFTAPGEKLWIPIWDPVVLNGDGYEKGSAFVTSHHGHTTYWLVMDYDTDARRALYARVTPDRDMGTVGVSIEANDAGGSTVNVAYQLTALSPTGNENLQESFTEAKYAEMMEEWRSMINGSREKIEHHFDR